MLAKHVSATPDHVVELVDNLRECDVKESLAYGIVDAKVGIAASVSMSLFSRAVIKGDDIVCIYGLVIPDILSGIGRPWLMGTDLIDRNRKQLIIDTRATVKEMLDITPTLVNWVHAENSKSIAWLRHSGFTVGEPELIGFNGAPFCEFRLSKG